MGEKEREKRRDGGRRRPAHTHMVLERLLRRLRHILGQDNREQWRAFTLPFWTHNKCCLVLSAGATVQFTAPRHTHAKWVQSTNYMVICLVVFYCLHVSHSFGVLSTYKVLEFDENVFVY